MPSTKKLLSVKSLGKRFPAAKTRLFQKERLYVTANEDVSFDIYEGETLGLVGESGCGKSTLGRVLLGLYRQTSGSTLYYGRRLAEIAPVYVEAILTNAEKRVAVYRRLQARAEQLSKSCHTSGDRATAREREDCRLAAEKRDRAFGTLVRLLGGFLSLDSCREGAVAILAAYRAEVQREGLLRLRREQERDAAALSEALAQSEDEARRAGLKKRLLRLQDGLRRLDGKIERARCEAEVAASALEALRGRYRENEEFTAFEALRDDGIELSLLTPAEMRFLRCDLQIIFQDPYSSLNPRMTVGQSIEEGPVTHGYFRRASPALRDYTLDVMRECGLQAHAYHRYPHQFSGGQRQRVAIARALAVKPKFVVCDECVSALDVSIRSQIINLLDDLKREEGLTYLFISHDLSVVRYISDRVGVMYLGHLVELGDTDAVFGDPRHPYTVALLSAIPTVEQAGAKRERIFLKGHLPSPIKPPSGCQFHTRCFMACERCKTEAPPTVEVAPGHFVACHRPERKIDGTGALLYREENVHPTLFE